MSDEIEYKFVRGQGWVAQYKKEEAPGFAALDWKAVTTFQPPRSYQYYIDDLNWYSSYQQYYQALPTIVREQIPSIPREPQAPSRYFPGSNTPAERAEVEETIHERRIREYREATRRFGRR